MANLTGFDANEVEPNVAFEPIPAGSYMVVITETEMKETKSGDGHYLEIEMEVIEGEYKGQRLWDRLNIDNPNEKATAIARGQLSAICRAVGVMQPKDSLELHNLPLVVGVKLQKRADNGELANVIKSYAGKGTPLKAATPAAAGPAQAAQAEQADAGTAPWLRP